MRTLTPSVCVLAEEIGLPALLITSFQGEEEWLKNKGRNTSQTELLQASPGKNGKPLEGRLGGSFPGPGGGAPSGRRRIAAWAIPPSGTVTLLRCGFLVTSYPRFFRGTGRGRPVLEWQPRAGAGGAQRRTAPQAWRGRRATRAPLPSDAPMVLAQTCHGEKPRSGAPPGQPGPTRVEGHRVSARDASAGFKPRSPCPSPAATCATPSRRLRRAGLAKPRAKRKQAQEVDPVRAIARATSAPVPEEKKRRLRGKDSPHLQSRSVAVARLGLWLPQPTCAVPGADVYATRLRGRRGEALRGRFPPANECTAPEAARARGWCFMEREVRKPLFAMRGFPQGARGESHS